MVQEVIWLVAAAVAAGAFVAWKFAQLNRRLKVEIRHRRKLEADFHERSTVDVVTGVLSRRGLMEALQHELVRATRYGEPMSLITLDFDNFKSINDTYGHAFGDRVLVAVAHACRDALRDPDFVGRLGGDEFVVGMPHTGPEGARQCALRILSAVATTAVPLPEGKSLSLTASVGYAVLQNDDSLDSLLARSDRAVYEAKRLGRNRIAAG